MNNWGLYPFVRLLIPLLTGIITGIKFLSGFPVSTNLLLLLIICTFVIISFPRTFITYRTRWIFGILVFCFILLSGIKISQITILPNNPFFFQKVHANIDYYVAVISDPLSEKSRSFKTILKIHYLQCDGKWISVDGNIVAYFKKDSIASRLEYGDRIIFKSEVKEVTPPQNPHEFDYKKYLSINNIYHQIYLKNRDYFPLDKHNGNPVFAAAVSARKQLLNSLSSNSLDKNEYAVAAALLLGYKDELDSDLRAAYSSAGAMHILCVSGLHVGVIFMVLNTLLGFLSRIHFGDKIKMILLLLTIWFYAFITGLSPSVLRASCMISLIIISKSLNRHVNIYNVLAASAFILLLINPYILVNIGFQLSYLAVIGIVSIYKYLYNLWSTGFIITDKLWSICAVSIAAQLATFPLSLFYFHQFPNLFLLTNIIVIPLSSLIIYCGMLVFAFIPVELLYGIFLEVLSFFVRLMNTLVNMIDEIDFSSSKMLYITEVELFIIYFVLILIILFVNVKKPGLLWFASFGIILFLGINIHQGIKSNSQKFLFVYNIYKISAYDFVSGKRNCIIADSLLLSDIKKQEYHIGNNWCALGSKTTLKMDVNDQNQLTQKELSEIGLFKSKQFVFFHGKRILILGRSFDLLPRSQKLSLDIIILSGNPDLSIEQLQKCLCFKEIIIDSSNSRWKAEIWIKECQSLGVEYWSVVHSGAYVCGF